MTDDSEKKNSKGKKEEIAQNLTDKSKIANIDDIENTFDKEYDLSKAKKIIPPDEKYVRRTAEDFAAGAQPAKAGRSHRLVDMKLRVPSEVKAAIDEAVQEAGCKEAEWLRAVVRQALRQGVDVRYELDTPIEIGGVSAPEPKDP